MNNLKQDWKKLLSTKRFSFDYENNKTFIKQSIDNDDYRSQFHQDYDRIIFSNSFRRLSRKTQVHPLSTNDHVHNRLTHSLEVASVGRSLGLMAGSLLQKRIDTSINPYDVSYIIQTACLAHDIGNPPFGHTGEDIIKNYFKINRNSIYLQSISDIHHLDFEHFDGNAQSFRIISKLENNFNKGGMRLCFSTLGCLVKYPRSSHNTEKFSFFQSEKDIFQEIFDDLGLIRGDVIYRHPLSYLMEVADDICYSLLDIKDAIELQIISLKDVLGIFKMFNLDRYEKIINSNQSESKKASILVAFCINALSKHSMEIFESKLDALLTNQSKHLIDMFSNKGLQEGIQEAKNFGYENIFHTANKKIINLGIKSKITFLLDSLIKAIYDEEHNNISNTQKEILKIMGDDKPNKQDHLYNKYQRIVDYISGMSDNYLLITYDLVKKISKK